MKHRAMIVILLLATTLTVAACAAATTPPESIPAAEAPQPEMAAQPTPDVVAGVDQGPQLRIYGSGLRLIGGYGDNLAYDGEGVQTGEGAIELHVNAERDSGSIMAEFTVERFHPSKDIDVANANVQLVFPLFGFPEGVDMPSYMEGGIADEVRLYGDSGNETAILPAVECRLATWGPVLVFVDGQQIVGGETLLGRPNPQGAFLGHMMYTPPMRDPDTNAIVNADGSGPYDPEDPSDAWEVTGDASVLHLMVRSEAEDERNYPPFDFYMAVRYEDTASTETMFTSHMTYAEMLAMSAEEVIEAAWPGWDWEALSEGAEPPERPVYPPCDENDDWDGDGHDRIACGGDDCADNDINRYPGNPERADFECLDEDCDPLTIANHDTIYLSGRSQFIPRPLLIQWQDGDEDGDGFIDERVCNHWSGDYGNWGEVFRGNDCDDNNPAVNPLQTEICNGMDDDCDGRIDEGLTMTAYPDNDGDLFGDPARPTQMCPHEVHSGWVNNNTDCDDTDPTVNPINGNCS